MSNGFQGARFTCLLQVHKGLFADSISFALLMSLIDSLEGLMNHKLAKLLLNYRVVLLLDRVLS